MKATLPIHGTLVAIDGHGILITGDPGSGKSELALGLLDRGHRLIADDAPLLEWRSGVLIGLAPSGFSGRIHITGVGVLDVRQLYGESSVCHEIALEFIIHLDSEAPPLEGEESLLGRWDTCSIERSELPRITLPRPTGRNLPLLVETLVRHRLPQKTSSIALTHQGNTSSAQQLP